MPRVCVVAGVGPGIGLAVASRFARADFQLALLARRPEAVQQYVAELSAEGASAYGASVDVADPASVERGFQAIQRWAGAPDVVVYNVAAVHPGLPSSLDGEELVRDFRANVVGALLCAQQVLPAMRARGSGTLLLTGGGLALHPRAEYAALALGKAAMRSLALTLAEELEPDGIHVATVTIAGGVQPGGHFDPAKIAEVYWRLYAQQRGTWEREIVYH